MLALCRYHVVSHMPMMDSLKIDSTTPLEVVSEAIPVLILVLELM